MPQRRHAHPTAPALPAQGRGMASAQRIGMAFNARPSNVGVGATQ
jgi:hypothetical protein